MSGVNTLTYKVGGVMEWIETYLHYVMHIDEVIAWLIAELGDFTYVLLFGVIFVETGLVIFSFLPGDSLLFASGAFAGADLDLNIWILLFGFFLAATLGDLSSYQIGKFTGKRIDKIPLFNKFVSEERLQAANAFFVKHGAITIIAARFMPVFRALIPFVAGASKMPVTRFMRFNMIGALIWGIGCTLLGYWFGNIMFVKENFSLVLILIMLTTFIPPIATAIRAKRA